MAAELSLPANHGVSRRQKSEARFANQNMMLSASQWDVDASEKCGECKMKRYLFFVLFFPAAFMNLMLVQASPTNLVKYFLAGYVVAVLPAMLMALICEVATSRSPAYKAGWCAAVAFITSPLMLAWAGLSPWRCLQVAAFGAVAGFLSVMIFEKKALLLLPSPAYFKKDAKAA
jgi:hypothetical protein